MLLAVHYRVMEHLGSLESTQEARGALGCRLGQLLRFFRALQTSCSPNFHQHDNTAGNQHGREDFYLANSKFGWGKCENAVTLDKIYDMTSPLLNCVSTELRHAYFSAFPGHPVLLCWNNHWHRMFEMIRKCTSLIAGALERSTVIRHAHFWAFLGHSATFLEMYVRIKDTTEIERRR